MAAEAAGPDRGETELVDRCVAGDESAFEALFGLYRDPLYGYALRMLRSAGEAEEAVVGIFERVFAALPSFRKGSPFKAWLYAIARNECLMQMRRGRSAAALRRAAAESHAAPDPFDEAAQSEARSMLRREVDRLEGHYREVVILSYFQGLNSREMARVLRTNENTVRTRLARALSRLRESMGGSAGR